VDLYLWYSKINIDLIEGKIKMPIPKVGRKKRRRRLDGAWRKKRSDAGMKRK
jgi:hypothetical protein